MKATKAGQAGRLESILKAAPPCGLMLDICPDSFGYRVEGRARRMSENVSFSSARDAVQIHYGNAIEGRRGKITLRRGHECYTVAAVLAGQTSAADALKSIRELLKKTADVKAWRPELDKAVCIIRNASADGLADEIQILTETMKVLWARFAESLPKSLANHFGKVYSWLTDLSGALAAADERPETILIDKEEEETMKKKTAATLPQVPETAAAPATAEERPEIIPETADEMKQAREAWKAARLAEIREDWRPHVETVLAAFPAVYSRLYNDKSANYSAETAAFDTLMKAPIWQEFAGACARVRGDCFTSDRECAAFVIACRETKEARKAFPIRQDEPSAPVETAETSAPADPAPESVAERPETISSVPAAEKTARGPAKEKDFAGESISGKGWSIVFDTGLNRTRVIVTASLREKLAPMIENAGFYYSKAMNSWNKKLTHKAHRAALALADEIRTALAS